MIGFAEYTGVKSGCSKSMPRLVAVFVAFLIMHTSQAAQALTPRELSARSTYLVQSADFEAAYKRNLDDKLLEMTRQRDAAKREVTQLSRDLRSSRGDRRALIERIEALTTQISDLNTAMAERLAAQEASFARQMKLQLELTDQFLETPEGLEALERLNEGGKTAYLEARQVLSRIIANRVRNRATLDYNAMDRGYVELPVVINGFERVLQDDRTNAGDWIRLSELYRLANRLEDSVKAAEEAFKLESEPLRQAEALIALGDSKMLLAGDRDAWGGFVAGAVDMVNAASPFAGTRPAETGNEVTPQMAKAMLEVVNGMKKMVGGLKPIPALDQARDHYAASKLLIDPGTGDEVAKVTLAMASVKHARAERLAELLGSVGTMTDLMEEFMRLIGEAILYDRLGPTMQPDEFQRKVAEMNVKSANLDKRMQEFSAATDRRNAEKQAEMASLLGEVESSSVRISESAKNVLLRRKLANLTEELVDFLGRFDQAEKARSAALLTLTLRESLAVGEDAGSVLAQELAKAQMLAGSALFKTDPVRARTLLESSLATRRAAATADPRSADKQRAVAESLAAVADTTKDSKDWQAVIDQFEAMLTGGLLAPSDNQNLALARTALATNSFMFAPTASPPAQ